MKHTILKSLFLALVLTGMVSCSNLVESATDTAQGILTISLDSGARTVRPDDPAAYTVVSYNVLGSGPASASFSSTGLTGSVWTKSGMVAGDWNITVEAVNTNGHVIATETRTVTIVDAVTTTAVFSPQRTSGTGTMQLTVQWAMASDYDAMSTTYSSLATPGTPVNADLIIDVAGTSANYTANVPAGDYLVNVTLKKGGSTIGTIQDVFQIQADFTTSATWNRSINAAPATWGYTSANPVYPIDFQGAGSLTVTVNNASGKGLYLVKANTSSLTVSAANTGAAASAVESLSWTKPSTLTAPAAPVPAMVEVTRMENTEATAFNANPPAFPKESRLAGIDKASSVSYGGTSPYIVNTSTKTFWVQDASSAWIQIPATLRAVGDYCYVWVADANYNNASAVTNDELLTSAQALALKDKFDGTSASSGQDGIFKNVTNIFGFEYGGGATGNGGVDGDQHVAILVYDIGFDYVSTQSGGVLGYFWGKDEYSQTQMDPYGLKTNLAEIFYVDSHFMDKYTNYIYSTLAHEYQHMINFNNKSVIAGQSSSAWYNEMCSMVCEDLVMSHIGLNPVTDGAISRMPEFNYHYAESGVSDWLTGNDVLKSYASAFAFGAYLERNFGGAQLFHAMAINSTVNTASISDALASLSYTETFADVFSTYGQALVFGTQPSGSSVKTFKQAVAKIINTVTYTASSFDLADFQQYNLAAGYTGTNGLRIYDAALAAIDLRPLGYQVLSKAAWTSLGASQSVTLTAPTDSGVKYWLMVK